MRREGKRNRMGREREGEKGGIKGETRHTRIAKHILRRNTLPRGMTAVAGHVCVISFDCNFHPLPAPACYCRAFP